MSKPWLSDEEVKDLCEPLTQPAAQVRYLRDSLALAVRVKPNGRPLVLRSNVEEVLGGLPEKKRKAKAPRPSAPDRQPDVAGLVLAFSRK